MDIVLEVLSMVNLNTPGIHSDLGVQDIGIVGTLRHVKCVAAQFHPHMSEPFSIPGISVQHPPPTLQTII